MAIDAASVSDQERAGHTSVPGSGFVENTRIDIGLDVKADHLIRLAQRLSDLARDLLGFSPGNEYPDMAAVAASSSAGRDRGRGTRHLVGLNTQPMNPLPNGACRDGTLQESEPPRNGNQAVDARRSRLQNAGK